MIWGLHGTENLHPGEADSILDDPKQLLRTVNDMTLGQIGKAHFSLLRATATHILMFGRRETASVVHSGLSRRERITDERRAAGEKNHDEA